MRTSIARIAHISDVHLLAPARRSHDLTVRFLSFGRALDGPARVRKLARALSMARRNGADHVVVSGDLTESGTDAQFDVLAGVLEDAALDPGDVTLVPGNHDAYQAEDGWRRALAGPLRPYRDAGAAEPGKIVERGDVAILPLDVAIHQPVTRSTGRVTDDAIDRVERRLRDPAIGKRATLVVQHHPPYAHASRAWQWVDGLSGASRLTALLARFPHVSVMHGHLHRVADLALGAPRSRVFGAPALVEDDEAAPSVRLYDVRDGVIESVGLAA